MTEKLKKNMKYNVNISLSYWATERIDITVEAKNKSDAEKTARLMYDDGELFTKDVNGYSSLVGLEGVSEAEVEVEANVVKEENE